MFLSTGNKQTNKQKGSKQTNKQRNEQRYKQQNENEMKKKRRGPSSLPLRLTLCQMKLV